MPIAVEGDTDAELYVAVWGGIAVVRVFWQAVPIAPAFVALVSPLLSVLGLLFWVLFGLPSSWAWSPV